MTLPLDQLCSLVKAISYQCDEELENRGLNSEKLRSQYNRLIFEQKSKVCEYRNYTCPYTRRSSDKGSDIKTHQRSLFDHIEYSLLDPLGNPGLVLYVGTEEDIEIVIGWSTHYPKGTKIWYDHFISFTLVRDRIIIRHHFAMTECIPGSPLHFLDLIEEDNCDHTSGLKSQCFSRLMNSNLIIFTHLLNIFDLEKIVELFDEVI